MFLHKKLTLGLVMACLLVPTTTMPMWARLRAGLTYENFKKGFSKICTGLSWGIAAGPFFTQAAITAQFVADEEKKLNFVPNASKNVQEFAYEELKKIGINDPTTIDIKCGIDTETPSPGVAYSKTIWINPKDDLNDNHYRFILQHEGTHILNKDLIYDIPANAIVPLITHFGLKKIRSLASITQAAPTAIPSMGRSLLKIPTGFGKFFTNTMIYNAYSRYKEQRADEGTQDDPIILQAGADWCKKNYLDNKNNMLKSIFMSSFVNGFVKESGSKHQIDAAKSKQFIEDLLCKYILDPILHIETHPHPLDRATRFEARIAKLKEQENKK